MIVAFVQIQERVVPRLLGRSQLDKRKAILETTK